MRGRRALRWLGGLAALAAVGLLALPVPELEASTSTVLYDREGRLVAASIADDGQWRFPAPDEVPQRYATAVLAFEDQGFRWHPGVDPLAVLRAVWLNLRAGHVVSGASTITMQVVRLSRPRQPRSLGEKLIEAALALRLELAASKDEILATYAGHAPFGGNTVGLEAATWRYFGRAPSGLTWAEAAVLAVLPNSPALLHPGRNRGPLKAKRDRLLRRLHEEGHLDDETLRLSLLEPLPDRPRALPQLAPHALAHQQIAGGGRARTALDFDLQSRSLEVLERHQRRQAAQGVHNLAAVVVDNDSGAVLAYHGNVLADLVHEDYVDVAASRRSTGSLLKPFLYEALFQTGELLPGELVPDVPLRIGGFAPQNYDRTFSGAVPADEALARSLNVPATALLRAYGVPMFLQRLRSLGMTTLDRSAADYGLSLVLGGAEGSVLEMAGMYASLARAGRGEAEARVRPWLFPDDEREPERAQLGVGSSWLTLEALLAVKRPGVDGSWRVFPTSRRVSWKTGTSFGHRDAWAVGATRSYTVAVWVGNADGEGRPGLTGHAAAAPVLFELFELLPPDPWFDRPRELVATTVCAESGMRAGPSCPRTEGALVTEAGAEGRPCSFCRTVHLDPRRDERVHGDCESVHAMRHEKWFVLPPQQAAFYRSRHAAYRRLPAWRPDCLASLDEDRAPMALLSPKPNTALYVPVELDGRRGRAVFEAAHRDRRTEIHWHLDERFVGTTQDIHQLELSPAPGEHLLTLVDEDGAVLRRKLKVLDPQTSAAAR